jgi:hypothetical protein
MFYSGSNTAWIFEAFPYTHLSQYRVRQNAINMGLIHNRKLGRTLLFVFFFVNEVAAFS